MCLLWFPDIWAVLCELYAESRVISDTQENGHFLFESLKCTPIHIRYIITMSLWATDTDIILKSHNVQWHLFSERKMKGDCQFPITQPTFHIHQNFHYLLQTIGFKQLITDLITEENVIPWYIGVSMGKLWIVRYGIPYLANFQIGSLKMRPTIWRYS